MGPATVDPGLGSRPADWSRPLIFLPFNQADVVVDIHDNPARVFLPSDQAEEYFVSRFTPCVRGTRLDGS